ncbi:MAG: hypothetical protein QGG40_14945, partial [Myxococcota bacterium]|nr:hypothetical protein [Myxococcota bacterium]
LEYDRVQYEFPPHIAHGLVSWEVVDDLFATLGLDAVGRRPREEWSPTAGLEDGPPFQLLHLGVSGTAGDRSGIRYDLGVRNVLDSEYHTLVYRDDADDVEEDGSPTMVSDIEGPGRSVVVAIEVDF